MKRGVIIAAALIVLLIPGALLAQGTCAKLVEEKEAVELSDEQLAKLEEMQLEHKMARIKLDAELEILEIKMHQELAKDDPSTKELDELISQIGDIKEKLEKMRIEHILEMRKIHGGKMWMHGSPCCGKMDDCHMMIMKGGAGGCGMAGCCSMGMGHQGMSCCPSMGMGHRGSGCCSMGMGHSGSGCCSMGMGHKGMECCGSKMGGCHGMHGTCCPGGGHMMTGGCCSSGAHKMIGSCCPGGIQKIEGCGQEKNVEKKIERRFIKSPSGE